MEALDLGSFPPFTEGFCGSLEDIAGLRIGLFFDVSTGWLV